jgi:hypothetical protein
MAFFAGRKVLSRRFRFVFVQRSAQAVRVDVCSTSSWSFAGSASPSRRSGSFIPYGCLLVPQKGSVRDHDTVQELFALEVLG